MDNRLRNLVALAAVAVALILGVLLGISTGIADRIFGGPNPKTIATASLESMRAQDKLTVFAWTLPPSGALRKRFSNEPSSPPIGSCAYAVAATSASAAIAVAAARRITGS